MPQSPSKDETSRQDLQWIRRRTNVEDLLDDGVENGSDLGRQYEDAGEPPDPDQQAVLRRRDETLDAVRAEQASRDAKTKRRACSPLGALLGFVITIAGLTLILHPIDARIEHRRMKYLPTSWEHVTPPRSRLYGAAGLAFGVALVGHCLRRPS